MELLIDAQREPTVPLVIRQAAAERIRLEVQTTAHRAANMVADAVTWWRAYPGREITVEDLVDLVYRWLDFRAAAT